MPSIRAFCRGAGTVAFSALTLAIPGCKGDTKVAVTQGPAGSYTISVASVSVVQGASNTTTITLNRLNGLTSIVGLSVEGVPVGLTASINPTSTTQSTATLTVTATSTVVASTYSFAVRGIAGGLGDQLATVSVTVTSAGPAGNFTLAGAAATVTQGGASVNAAINITRTGGFAGTISFSATGVPVGLTVVIAPVLVTTGANTVVTLTASATLAPTTYNVIIHGTASGVTEQVATLVVTVTAAGGGGGGSGNVTLDWSACPTASKAIWVAFQDGSGAWTRVTGTADVYRFTVNAKGGYAYVTQTTATATGMNLNFGTGAELSAAPLIFCATTSGSKTYSGNITGASVGDFVTISIGGSAATIIPPSLSFNLNNVPAGTFDAVGSRRSLLTPGVGDRGFLRRDVNSPTGTGLPVMDYNGSESFPLATATFSLSGNLTGDNFLQSMSYATGASCTLSAFAAGTSIQSTPAPFTASGVPAGSQRATDFHVFSITATSTTNSQRTATEAFHTLGARTITLPPDFAAPVVTVPSGPYKILSAAINTTGYNSTAGLFYATNSGTASVSLVESAAYMGGTAATLLVPDLSAAAAFLPAWMPASGTTVNWQVFVAGLTSATSFCTEGARFVNASRSGTN